MTLFGTEDVQHVRDGWRNISDQSCQHIKAPGKQDTGALSYVLYRTQSGTQCRCHGNAEQVMDCWKGTEKDFRFAVFFLNWDNSFILSPYLSEGGRLESVATVYCSVLQPDQH